MTFSKEEACKALESVAAINENLNVRKSELYVALAEYDIIQAANRGQRQIHILIEDDVICKDHIFQTFRDHGYQIALIDEFFGPRDKWRLATVAW